MKKAEILDKETVENAVNMGRSEGIDIKCIFDGYGESFEIHIDDKKDGQNKIINFIFKEHPAMTSKQFLELIKKEYLW